MQIHISTQAPRKRPKAGDVRKTKAHGLQIRIPVVVRHGPYAGALVVNRGKQVYEWVSVAEACALGYKHLLPPALRPTPDPQPLGYMQGRGAA
jgi:hypothetical protein